MFTYTSITFSDVLLLQTYNLQDTSLLKTYPHLDSGKTHRLGYDGHHVIPLCCTVILLRLGLVTQRLSRLFAKLAITLRRLFNVICSRSAAAELEFKTED